MGYSLKGNVNAKIFVKNSAITNDEDNTRVIQQLVALNADGTVQAENSDDASGTKKFYPLRSNAKPEDFGGPVDVQLDSIAEILVEYPEDADPIEAGDYAIVGPSGKAVIGAGPVKPSGVTIVGQFQAAADGDKLTLPVLVQPDIVAVPEPGPEEP